MVQLYCVVRYMVIYGSMILQYRFSLAPSFIRQSKQQSHNGMIWYRLNRPYNRPYIPIKQAWTVRAAAAAAPAAAVIILMCSISLTLLLCFCFISFIVLQQQETDWWWNKNEWIESIILQFGTIIIVVIY